jgi:membrane protease subunit HflK
VDWNQPPSGPDLEQMATKVKNRLKGFKLSGGGSKLPAWLIPIFLIVAAAATTFYTVDPEETGVILRFGQYVRLSDPGLHLKAPFGVEKVIKVKTGRILKEEFGFRTTLPGIRSQFTKAGFDDESLMLSGDLNVIDCKWIVQYRIKNPEAWLFKVLDGRIAIRDLSEAVVRRVVGNRYSDDVLTVQRVEIAALIHQDLQKILDFYNVGVQVVTVQLQDVNPPEPVQPAFNAVNEARQERERIINQAQAEYNKIIPRAEGEAQQMIAEAEGYALTRINEAKGEANRFLAVLKEYQQAQEVTRQRLYLESIQKLLKKTNKIYILDEDQKNLLPLMSLEAKEVKK